MTPIFINARFLTQPITGVQRFAIEICKELIKLENHIQLVAPHDVLDQKLAEFLKVKVIGTKTGHLWEQFELPNFLKKQNKPTLLNLCNTAPLFYRNNIITLHDLAFIKHPEWFSFAFRTYYNFMTPRIASKAKYIFTVSNSVKIDLQTAFNLTVNDVSVIYNGLPSVFLENHKAKKNSTNSKPYFVAFGGTNPRKNLKNIVAAMELLNSDEHELHVISRAEKNFNGKAIDEKKFTFNLINQTDIDDQKLKALYQNATGLIYPSFYEGFGLPPLEAINSGCPILLSRIDVFEELYSEIATFCNPNDPQDIKNGIEKIISSQQKTISSDQLEIINNKYSYWKAANTINKKLAEFYS